MTHLVVLLSRDGYPGGGNANFTINGAVDLHSGDNPLVTLSDILSIPVASLIDVETPPPCLFLDIGLPGSKVISYNENNPYSRAFSSNFVLVLRGGEYVVARDQPTYAPRKSHIDVTVSLRDPAGALVEVTNELSIILKCSWPDDN